MTSLDLRKPIAALFLLLGSILAGYGWLVPEGQPEVRVASNVNLVWGLVMIGFGLLLFLLAKWRGARA